VPYLGHGSNWTSNQRHTAHVTLYCTWRPSGLATRLHGQGNHHQYQLLHFSGEPRMACSERQPFRTIGTGIFFRSSCHQTMCRKINSVGKSTCTKIPMAFAQNGVKDILTECHKDSLPPTASTEVASDYRQPCPRWQQSLPTDMSGRQLPTTFQSAADIAGSSPSLWHERLAAACGHRSISAVETPSTPTPCSAALCSTDHTHQLQYTIWTNILSQHTF